ncbi:MAG: hypothetical protein HMLKMBBP_01693 [Planctomycetes bacterium]|nr:hypothetical protein [Planctomycetota bacterium]
MPVQPVVEPSGSCEVSEQDARRELPRLRLANTRPDAPVQLRVRGLRAPGTEPTAWIELAVPASDWSEPLRIDLHADGQELLALEILADAKHLSRAPLRVSQSEAEDGVLRVQMPAAVSIQGVVPPCPERTASPVVYAFPDSGAFETPPEDAATCDLNGRFDLRLREGVRYRVVAVAADGAPSSTSVDAREGATLHLPDLRPERALSGGIHCDGFDPVDIGLSVVAERASLDRVLQVPDGTLGIVDGEVTRVRARATVDRFGGYRVPSLGGGEARLTVLAARLPIVGGPSVQISSVVEDLGVLDLRATRVVVEAPGLPDGSTVLATAGTGTSTAATLASGRCEFLVSADTDVEFRAGRGPLTRRAARGRADDRSHITLSESVRVEPTVSVVASVSPTDRFLGGVTVELWDPRNIGRSIVEVASAAVTDGTAILRLRSSGSQVLLMRPWTRTASERSWWVPRAEVAELQDVVARELPLIEGGRLSIVCRDESGRPVSAIATIQDAAGRRFVLFEHLTAAGISLSREHLCPSGVTNLRDPLPEGEYQVEVTTPSGLRLTQSHSVRREQTTACVFVVR